MTVPTVIEENSNRECHRAKWWRLHVIGLTVEQLAELTGYSTMAIYLMERGINSSGHLVKPWAWQRYKMACAGAVHGREFNWS